MLLLTDTPKRDHITAVLTSLQWLPVSFTITFKFLLFVYKTLHGLAAFYIFGHLQPCPASRSLWSAEQMLLTVLCSVFKVKETCILVVVSDLWKSIALIVKCAPSTESFKTRLKTYFPLAFESVWFVHVFVSCVCLAPTMYFTCFFLNLFLFPSFFVLFILLFVRCLKKRLVKISLCVGFIRKICNPLSACFLGC